MILTASYTFLRKHKIYNLINHGFPHLALVIHLDKSYDNFDQNSAKSQQTETNQSDYIYDLYYQ